MTWNTSLVDGPFDVPIYGQLDPDTGARQVTGLRAGYHLNLPAALQTEALEPFRIEPSAPTRVFAGDDAAGGWATGFYRFTDEAGARAQPGLAPLWIEDEPSAPD